MSIFISIPAYCDPDLTRTVNSAISAADNPDDLYFSIVQQCDEDDRLEFNSSNIKSLWMPRQEARGVGFARDLAIDAYDGEDFYFQIDSHMVFPKGWDTSAVEEYNMAVDLAENERVIINQWPRKFEVMKNNDVMFPSNAPPPTKNTVELQKRMLVHPVRQHFSDWNSVLPEESKAMNAGLIFAPGRFVEEVPPDPYISFWGEEMTASMRAWTNGYRFFAPKRWIAAHRYLRSGKVHRIQDQKGLYARLSIRSHDRQLAVWLEEDLGIYGVPYSGAVSDYSDFVGLDLADCYVKRYKYFSKHEKGIR